VKKSLPRLVDLALQALKPAGHLFAATNFSDISTGLLERWIKGAAELLHKPIKKMVPLGQDKDFSGSGSMKESYLSALLVNFK
jgi:23S rRNA G2069 N7-methylase RlmK/C1962 C5-methylase RlmI